MDVYSLIRDALIVSFPIIDRTVNEDTKQTDGVTRRLWSCGGNDADAWGGAVPKRLNCLLTFS